jgi:hypothetical protein
MSATVPAFPTDDRTVQTVGVRELKSTGLPDEPPAADTE